jgi:hypothetical protein
LNFPLWNQFELHARISNLCIGSLRG